MFGGLNNTLHICNMIGKQLEELRKQHNLTMDKLAEQTKVNQSNISRILRGKINVSEKMALRLAHGIDPKSDYELKLVKKEG